MIDQRLAGQERRSGAWHRPLDPLACGLIVTARDLADPLQLSVGDAANFYLVGPILQDNKGSGPRLVTLPEHLVADSDSCRSIPLSRLVLIFKISQKACPSPPTETLYSPLPG